MILNDGVCETVQDLIYSNSYTSILLIIEVHVLIVLFVSKFWYFDVSYLFLTSW